MSASRLPPLSSLRAFEAAARHRSFSGAARELNVTHPAIAQQVRRLEDWFGFRLMERSGRGMALTETGARLAAGLIEGFGVIAGAVNQIAADAEARPLRITMTPGFAVGWFMPCVGVFRAAHPDVELMINPTSQVIDLVADDYDVAFRFGTGDWPGLDVERIVATDVVPVASREFANSRNIKGLSDLARVPWVQELDTNEVDSWMAAHGIDRMVRRNILNVPGSILIDQLRQGAGVGLLARSNVAEDLAAGRLVALFEDEADPDLGYYMVTRPQPHRKAVSEFVRWARRDLVERPTGDCVRASAPS